MSRQTRTLLVLVVMSVIGLTALTLMAQRYTRILSRHDDAAVGVAPAALARVDDFIEVRRELQREIQRLETRETAGVVTVELLRRVREEALARYGVDDRDYHEVREAYRSWRAGWQLTGPLPNAAFDRRRGTLEQLDLGPYERLDA